ncbi:hypothetical protein KJ359_009789 [Pestalotiopsis sp. 9143b]|nr:hypothetical protein KJ359_009789 [Pestalotiopsis sp. 9143b]
MFIDEPSIPLRHIKLTQIKAAAETSLPAVKGDDDAPAPAPAALTANKDEKVAELKKRVASLEEEVAKLKKTVSALLGVKKEEEEEW